MTIIAFTVSTMAGATVLALSLATLRWPQLRFWPPPGVSTWQYTTFWWLFRIFIVGLALVCITDFGSIGIPHLAQYAAGIPLAIAGFGSAFFVTYELGWRDAHGEANSLTTDGWYAWSRNPIYVVSIIGMAGLGMAVHSWPAYGLLSLWAAIYIAAPYLEEPWLEQRYGDAYRHYKSTVPRFLGIRSLRL